MSTTRSIGVVVLAALGTAATGVSCSSAPPPHRIDLGADGETVTTGSSYVPTKTDAIVRVPRIASEVVSLRDPRSDATVRFALAGASDIEARSIGGRIRYARALAGSDVVRDVRENGVEDFVVFGERPAHEEVAYVFSTTALAGLRLVANTLEMVDEAGAPRLRVLPPYLVDALGAHVDASLAVEGCAVDTSPVAPWGRSVVPPGAASCTLVVRWSNARYPAILDPEWQLAGTLPTRTDFSAIHLLKTGKVLVTSGFIYGSASLNTTSWLYDPATRTTATTGALSTTRQDQFSALLNDGRVLVGGGFAGSAAAKSAEVYDPSTGLFTATGALHDDRQASRATTMASGKVLVSGGGVQTAEIYDPSANTFATTGAPLNPHSRHVSLLLPSGKVFVAAGDSSSAAEVFDPAMGTFASAGAVQSDHEGVSGTLLKDGTVLMVGGNSGNAVDATARVYDPGAGTIGTVASLTAARADPAMAVLDDGRALVAGGSVEQTTGLTSTEIYDPVAKAWSLGPTMKDGRSSFSVISLGGGHALAVGDSTDIEIFDDLPLGAACKSDAECDSSLCVDGVCCSSACTGQCEACDVTGHEGTCTPAKGLAHGKAKACAGTDATCGGTCDGVDTKVCSFAQASSACGATCANGQLSSSSCNGQGACVVSDSHACPGNYACADATTCGTTCTTKAECATGFSCKDGSCVQTAKCVSDRISQAIDGTRAECAPYRCDDSATGDGTCKTSCTSVDDCVGGDVCSSEHTCVAASQSSDSGGCNVGSAGSSSSCGLTWLAFAILGMARRRRAGASRRRAL